MKNETTKKVTGPGGTASDIPYGSNSLYLSPRQWLCAAVACVAVLLAAPAMWERAERFEPGPDYRIPYELSGDYWLYERYCRWACNRYKAVVVGDSVVWGHYVARGDSLCGHLNALAGSEFFANLGLDGTHPAALAGLLRYYGKAISGKRVVLHFNPLWLSSARHDLRSDKEHRFNHPKLVPQFIPRIPCYKAPLSRKFSVAVHRSVRFFSWAEHLNIAYFASTGVPAWTVEHPYDCPLGVLTFRLPDSDDYQRPVARGVSARRVTVEWVELETSLQWRFFRDSIDLLKRRGNKVFVLVGPFNEHLLDEESLGTYRRMQQRIRAWLDENRVPSLVAPVLEAGLYADASHPLGRGYRLLAELLFENDGFRSEILELTARK